jgi:hypothetical protein
MRDKLHDRRLSIPVAWALACLGALAAEDARAGCCQWIVEVNAGNSYQNCRETATATECTENHGSKNPTYKADERCFERRGFCISNSEETSGAQEARWSHALGSTSSCTGPAQYQTTLVPTGDDCTAEPLCTATTTVASGSSPADTAALVRARLEATCSVGFDVGGGGAQATTLTTGLAYDVCVNGTRIAGPTTLDSAAVCATASGTQTAEGVSYRVLALPSLSAPQWLLLALLLGLAGGVALRRLRPASA